ncbi:MAG: 8-amino-7-oxononanoate synthase [Kiritimatiellaeota bacterium]|nr:8-amino-7-oxononanoate synthase [Kiritimatiellota bacterium]
MDLRERWLEDELEKLRQQHLYREARAWPETGGRVRVDGRALLNFSSNDYLDLAHHPTVLAAAEHALRAGGAGATASRLVVGTLPLHEELEARLARLKGCPAALVFGSGYLANAGTVPALAGRGDTIFADRLAHASLVDAVLLSRAELLRFRHNDVGHLDELLSKCTGGGRKLVVTESVFSMDGDLAPLPELAAVAGRHGALLLVDEAHATGVFGPGGGGVIRELGLESAVNVSMGTLSKALGGYGGFVAVSARLREWLINRARAFIFSTALPPAMLGAALGALDVLEQQPGAGAELLRRAAAFRQKLQAAGLDTMASASQIIPILVGDNARALALAARLRAQGLLVVAIRPPTVPAGSARLRLSVTLAHTTAELDRAAELIVAAAREEALPNK